MKIFLAIFLMLLSATAHSNVVEPNIHNSATFHEDLPKPDGGVKIIPAKKSLNEPNNAVLIAQKQIKEKGYYNTYTGEAKTLMAMKNEKMFLSLKTNVEDLHLAFPFKGIPVDPKKVVGYAAALSYEKNKGWTGVTVIFTDLDLGTCQYTLFNWKLSHGSALIPEEVVRYDVNGKITTLDVRGNDQSGYIQTLHWANDSAMNNLLCANQTFKKINNEKLIELAKKIDKFVEPSIR